MIFGWTHSAKSHELSTKNSYGGVKVQVFIQQHLLLCISPLFISLSLSLSLSLAVLAMSPVAHPSLINRVELMSHTWVPVIWKQVFPPPLFHLSALLALCLSQCPRGLGCHGQDNMHPIDKLMDEPNHVYVWVYVCAFVFISFCVRVIPEWRQLFLSDRDSPQIWFDGKEKQSKVNVIYRRKWSNKDLQSDKR